MYVSRCIQVRNPVYERECTVAFDYFFFLLKSISPFFLFPVHLPSLKLEGFDKKAEEW